MDEQSRSVAIGRLLDHAAALLTLAEPLPRRIRSRRLGAQAAAILTLAHRLLARLRASDPWTQRVRLGAVDWLAGAVSGLSRLIFGR